MTDSKEYSEEFKKRVVPAPPHWERGYRCHGYWCDGVRVGYVALTPPGFEVTYSWECAGKGDRRRKLWIAKACVEGAWASMTDEERQRELSRLRDKAK